MIFTGGKRSSAVLAACEKRRSGLAPKTTQGPGTKTESSIFGMPNQQVRRAASLSASGRVDGAACAQEYSGGAGAGLRPASRPPIWLVKNRKIEDKTRQDKRARASGWAGESGCLGRRVGHRH